MSDIAKIDEDLQKAIEESVGKLAPWPQTTKTSQEIEDALVRARVQMLLNEPFFGNMATRLNFIDATKWCPTIAVDGRNFYYNRDFVAALPPQQLIFGVAHEVMHCIYNHMDLHWIGDRNRPLVNISQDHVINLELDEAGVGETINIIEICMDRRFRGMVWEEVYDILAKENPQMSKMPRTIDVHLDGSESDDEGQGGSEGDDANDGTNGPIRYSDAERQKIKHEVTQATIQAAKAAGKQKTPNGIKKAIDKLLNPQIDWRDLLAQQIKSILRSDFTMAFPSRKGISAGIYLPSMDRDETIDITIAIDISGSIGSDMMRDFLSEIYGILSQYTDYKVRLWSFDTAVHNDITISPDNAHVFDEYELTDGGGTLFECNWDYMKEQGIEPKKFIMFTYGYPCGSWGDEHYCDTIFIVHGGGYGSAPEAPFGISVPYKREDMAEAA
jgi:predicted metal-dependent peptidase